MVDNEALMRYDDNVTVNVIIKRKVVDMPVTLRDIAEKAGVSIITVSRVMNGKPDVLPETRQRILSIARDLNYTPNAHARALVGGKSKIIGLVVADNANPFYARMIRGIEEAASANGYSVILSNTNEDLAREAAAIQILREKRVDGLLITSVQCGKALLEPLLNDHTPFVLLNRYVDGLDTDCVLNDNFLGALQATAHLCSLGHRRILHLTGPENISSVRERLRGYHQALADCGISPDPRLVLHTNLKLDDGYQKILTQFPLFSPAPTAIFAYSDLLAFSVLKAMRELGIAVPGQVALVGYDDIDFAQAIEPALTTVSQPAFEMGFKGAEILLNKIQNPSQAALPARQVIFPPQLVVRASSGAAIPR